MTNRLEHLEKTQLEYEQHKSMIGEIEQEYNVIDEENALLKSQLNDSDQML